MTSQFLLVETSKIVTSTYRVERSIESDGVLTELKNNINNYGIKVPLIVTLTDETKYQLVDGHRRLQCAIALGLEKIPCVIEQSDKSTEIALSVNIHREDLTSVEIGQMLLEIYNSEKQKDSSFKYAKLSNFVNKSKAYISQHIGYVEKLSDEIQQDILDNKRMIDKNILNRIYTLDEDDQIEIYKQVVAENLGRESVQKLIDELGNDDTVDDTETSPSSDTTPTVTDALYISNGFLEFKLKSDALADDEKEKFEIEFQALLKKYKLSEEGLTC